MELIAQLQEVADVTGRLTETGIVAILLFFILSGGAVLGIFFWKIFNKLFGNTNEQGLLPKIADAHVEFLNRVSDSLQESSAVTKEISGVSKKIDSTVNKIAQSIKNNKLNRRDFSRVWKYHIKILRTMATKIGVVDEIESSLNEIEEVLQYLIENPDSEFPKSSRKDK